MINLFKIAILLLIIVMLAIVVCNTIINKKSNPYIYNDTHEIPNNNTGLLLGTSQYLKNGKPNMYFAKRIKAAVDLYKSGKIRYIVASGDNNSVEDNEPLDMKNALIAQGVPDSAIYLDFAGLRTFDSVIRIKKIFGQSSFTVISQKFHNQRAVYIARLNGYNAIAYNAEDVSAYSGFKTNVREKLARVKVFIDILTNKQPRFLGDPVEIGKPQNM